VNTIVKVGLSESEKQEESIQRRIRSWETRLLAEALSIFMAEGELPQWLKTALNGSSYKPQIDVVEAVGVVEYYTKHKNLSQEEIEKVFNAWIFLGSARFYEIYDLKKKESRPLRVSYGNATARVKPLACCGRRPRRQKFARL